MDTLDHVDDRVAPATDAVEAGETRHQVRAALLKLTPEQREVVMLRHFGAMSYAEMAAALGIPEKTVKSRLFSGRQRLCGLLASARG
jgi:RNA polymerase sigma-70 factor (ECF subfamily)